MRKFGLIGKKLDHSFSKTFFTELFARNEIRATYENVELTDVSEFLKLPDLQKFSGLNVTIPYKTAIIPFLDEVSEEAAQIGAVNTVRFSEGRMIGYNTDAFGFRQSIKPFLNSHHERALILGTGGASKAVEFVLKDIGLKVIFASRYPQGADQFSYESINEHMVRACGLIVNCTPVGTFPNTEEMPDFPTNFLTPEHLVVDLIYNPEKTRLLREAEKQGSLTLNGHSMLKEQALKAWEIWNS